MEQHLAEVWSRIQSFSIDEGQPAFPFAARLARENGWTRDYTERVIEEYKRFLLLMVAAGHPVSPSDPVDQAWHLHLTYTRSYWDQLCGEIVGRPLHHGPTRGGEAEHEKFHDWYADTLASYERIFQESPPADIWPDPASYSNPRSDYRRIDVRRNWVVPRGSRLSRWVAATVLGVGLFAGLRAVGEDGPVVAQQIGGGDDLTADSTIWFWLLLLALGISVFKIFEFFFRRRCPSCRAQWAFFKTNQTRAAVGGRRIEWKCRRCEYIDWRLRSRRRRGGSSNAVTGDGGCSSNNNGGWGDWFGGGGDGGGDGGGCGGGGCGGGGCGGGGD